MVGNTFSDINGPTSDYVIPSTNTTANSAYANDVYDGLTPATAKATLAAARAVAATMPGSQIVINGLIAETSNVPFVNNVTHVGFSGDNTVDLVKYYGESSSSATAIQLGNGCDYINIGFETDLDDQIVVGSNPDDPANDDVRLFNCRIEGWMNALRVQPSGGTSCIKAYRTTFRRAHGTCGMLAPCSLYFSDCIFSATNSPFLQGKGTLAIQWAEGHACLRDTDVESTIDSQSPTSVAITVEGTQYPWTSAAISAAEVSGSRSIVLINSRLFGTTADLILFGVLNGTGDNKTTGWWAYNSPLSKAKNASAILTLRSLYLEFNNGVYQRNPAVIVPCAS